MPNITADKVIAALNFVYDCIGPSGTAKTIQFYEKNKDKIPQEQIKAGCDYPNAKIVCERMFKFIITEPFLKCYLFSPYPIIVYTRYNFVGPVNKSSATVIFAPVKNRTYYVWLWSDTNPQGDIKWESEMFKAAMTLGEFKGYNFKQPSKIFQTLWDAAAGGNPKTDFFPSDIEDRMDALSSYGYSFVDGVYKLNISFTKRDLGHFILKSKTLETIEGQISGLTRIPICNATKDDKKINLGWDTFQFFEWEDICLPGVSLGGKKGVKGAKEVLELAELSIVSPCAGAMVYVWPDPWVWKHTLRAEAFNPPMWYRPTVGYQRKQNTPAYIQIYQLNSVTLEEAIKLENLRQQYRSERKNEKPTEWSTYVKGARPTLVKDALFQINQTLSKQTYFYTDFMMTEIVYGQEEVMQYVPTKQGRILFFGKGPMTLQVTGLLMNTEDFPWKDEFLKNYRQNLGGSDLAKAGRVAAFVYDNWAHLGYITAIQMHESADREDAVLFSFVFMAILVIELPNKVYPGKGQKELEERRKARLQMEDITGKEQHTPSIQIEYAPLIDLLLKKIFPGLGQDAIHKIGDLIRLTGKGAPFPFIGMTAVSDLMPRGSALEKSLAPFDFDVLSSIGYGMLR